jgi:hypothetical protein
VTQPAPLPNFFQAIAPIGSQWAQSYQVTNDDGTLANITNKTFELVVRNTQTAATVFSVSSTASTTYGTITVTSSSATLQVVLTPTATNLLTGYGANYALWMDPNLNDATTLVAGVFYGRTVAQP